MNAELYVYAGSFAHNGVDSDLDVLTRIQDFHALVSQVDLSENTFLFNNDEFLNTVILSNGTTCEKLLFSNDASINHDIKSIFTLLITKGLYQSTTLSGENIDDILGLHDDKCCAKVVLARTIDAENRSKQIVATYADWKNFRLYILGLRPENQEYFYSQCEKYFDNLIFSNDYRHLTAEVLVSHPISIVNALNEMDKHLLSEFQDFKGSNIDFPQHFAGNHNITDGGSFQGDGKKKEEFKANFLISKKKIITRICEPHLKFNSPDEDKRRQKDINKYCRIHFAIPIDGDSKVFIGAIRRHV